MEDITNGMTGLTTEDSAEVRDRRVDIIRALANFPHLQSYFTNCATSVMTDGEPIQLITETEITAVPKTLAIFEDMAGACEVEFDRLRGNNNELTDVNTKLNAKLVNLNTKMNNEVARLNGLLKQAEEHSKAIEKALTLALSKSDREEAVPIKHPEPFTGDEPDLAKRTESFRHWRQRIRSLWIDYPRKFGTERQRLTYFLTALGGSALRQISKRLEVVIENPESSDKWAWKKADEVIVELATQYETFDKKTDAFKKMTELRQDGEYADYDQFAARFSSLATTLEWDDKTRVMQFEMRLCGKLKKAIETRDDMPDTNDFKGWVEKCRKISNRMATAAALGKMSEGLKKTPIGNSNANTDAKKDSNKGDPMDLDKMNLALARVPQEVLDYRLNNGLCFNCGESGHSAKKCQKKTDTGRGRGRGNRGRGGFGGFGRGNGFGGFGRGINNGYQNNGYQQQAGGGGFGNPSNGFGGFGRGQQPFGNGQQYGNGGRGFAPPNQGGRGGGPQLRFANVPEYIPYQSGFVVGEVESDYGGEHNNANHGSNNDTQHSGNA